VEVVNSLLWVGIAGLILRIVLGDASVAVHRAAFLFLLYIPLAFVTGCPAAILQGKLRLGLFNAFRFTVHPTYTLLLLILWLAGGLTLASAVGASLSASALALVLFLAPLFRSGAFAWHWDVALVRSLLGFGLRVHAGNVAMLAASQLALVVLAWLRPPADVGLYVAAGTVGGVMTLVPSALGMVLFPVLASQPPIVRRQTLAALLRVGFPLSLLALVPAVLVLPRTMGPLFGRAFEDAEGTARLLVVAYFFRGWLSILASAIRALGRPLRSGLGEIVGLPVLLVTLLLVVPEHGHLGAAAATAAAAGSGVSVLMGVVIAEGVTETALPARTEAEPEPSAQRW
jgi:O-antigen/teichoic acid export membrane protein